jgi:hypothetical protein
MRDARSARSETLFTNFLPIYYTAPLYGEIHNFKAPVACYERTVREL